MAKPAMATAKIFMNGRSQAVRIPKEFRFEGKEVHIRREKNGILILPKVEDAPPSSFKELMGKMGLPPPEAGRDYFKEVFGEKRRYSPPGKKAFLYD